MSDLSYMSTKCEQKKKVERKKSKGRCPKIGMISNSLNTYRNKYSRNKVRKSVKKKKERGSVNNVAGFLNLVKPLSHNSKNYIANTSHDNFLILHNPYLNC